MYISLYTARQLEKIKENMLWLGLFMLSGGLAALLNDIVLLEKTRWAWAYAAFLISTVGVLLIAVSKGSIPLKEAFFSITPTQISYRLSLLGREHIIYWQHVAKVQLSERCILFDLNGGRQVLLNLSALHSSNTANHIAVSVQTAALEHHVTLDGVKFNTPNASVGSAQYH